MNLSGKLKVSFNVYAKNNLVSHLEPVASVNPQWTNNVLSLFQGKSGHSDWVAHPMFEFIASKKLGYHGVALESNDSPYFGVSDNLFNESSLVS